MLYGLDYKAAGKFEKVILDEHPNGWAAGGFVELSGWPSAIPTFTKLLETGRCPLLRLELSWADDNHNYGNEEFQLMELNARASVQLIQRCQNYVKFFVAPVVEHKLKERDWLRFANATNNILQGCKYELVNSPMVSSGFVSRSILNEYHGADLKPRGGRCAFSHDGTNAVDSNMEDYKKNYAQAEYFLIWNSQMNGNRVIKEEDPKKQLPRAKRIYYPVGQQLDSWIYLSRDRGVVRIPKDWILKSHGDQHSVPPKGKDQKPVVITPPKEKYREIVLMASNGQVIARAPYFGTWNEKPSGKLLGHRYYFNDWGYLLAEKARRIHGSPVCEIWVNNKKVGTWNPAFRGGKFR